MNTGIIHIAVAFRIGAFVLGFSSLTVIALYGVLRLRQWLSPPVSPSAIGKNPDILVLTVSIIARVLGAGAKLFEQLGTRLLGGLAAISLCVLIYAVALWFTGRGLQAHAGWARAAGGVLIFAPTVVGLLSLAVVRGWLRLPLSLLVLAGIFSFWTLWRGFNV